MIKKERAFSLAELLISLLVTSMILAATVPTITRKAATINENPWKYSKFGTGNDIYAATGSGQSLLVGNSTLPVDNVTDDNYHNGSGILSSDNDKIIITKDTGNNSSFLSLYTKSANGENFTNTGRLIANKTSIGFGTNVFKTDLGNYNTAFGQFAMQEGGGNYNVAIGMKALNKLSKEEQNGNANMANTAIGHFALNTLKKGSYSTAVGTHSLSKFANSNGGNNTAVGAYSEYANTKGIQNTAVGTYTLYKNEAGKENTAIGHYALYTLNIPDSPIYNYVGSNTAIGSNAMKEIEFGFDNTVIGARAFEGTNSTLMTLINADGSIARTASGNTAIGKSALASNTEGTANVAIGRASAMSITNANANTIIGYESFKNISEGSNNVAIGACSLGGG